MIFQRTISSQIRASGVGLHSGNKVSLTLIPAEPNSGINFIRKDLSGRKVKCDPFKVKGNRLSTTLVDDKSADWSVGTIEHLMSALAGFGIDNLIVEIDAPETPIFDGSAVCFLYLLSEAGIKEQLSKKRYIKILRELSICDGDKFATLCPFNGFKMRLGIDFSNPLIKSTSQSLEINFVNQCYSEELSRARTFGFVEEVELMRAMGLALGGGIENAILVDGDRILNPQGLRYKDEFVRHKLLDVVGDLYTACHPLIGSFHGYKTGHYLNNELLRKLLSNAENYEFVEFSDVAEVPSSFHRIPID